MKKDSRQSSKIGFIKSQKKGGILILGLLLIFWGIFLFKDKIAFKPFDKFYKKVPEIRSAVEINPPQISPSPTPTPTPKPLSFAEMNTLYGPCATLPVLIYHHIADLKTQPSPAVSPEFFRKQMEYLRDKGYVIIGMQNLVDFFDKGSPLPGKAILLAFDDGYSDFATNAYPILKEFGFPATVFLATGLVENSNYLSWPKITEMAGSGNILFANHTWSHQSMVTSKEVIEKEILLADKQLKEKGLNSPKVFAYPYGLPSSYAEQFLANQGYSLAFTTDSGSLLCKKQRLGLPRMRIGNAALSQFGL